jgi:AraC-like DNA-binding protein
MKIGARPLLVLHGDDAFRERLRMVAGREYTFQAVHDWSGLEEAVRDAPPSALVVVNPYEGSSPDAGPSLELKTLLVEFPSTAVFAALDLSSASVDDVRTLGKWGVVQVIALGHDDTATGVVYRFREAQGRPLKALLWQVLPADTSAPARGIIDAAVEVVAVGGHGRDLARQLRFSRRTLLRWCKRAELPPPRKLLAWMRILLAAELLDDPGRTVLSVAHACGYSSDSGLRRVTQKFVGASPSELRRRGAFARSSKVFLEVLAEHREAAPAFA